MDVVELGNTSSPQTPVRTVTNTLPAGSKTYKVEAGDTLSHIALKMYGTSSKSAQEAILNANPNLKNDPNKVVQGRSYVIPPFEAPMATNTTDATRATIAANTTPTTRPWPDR